MHQNKYTETPTNPDGALRYLISRGDPSRWTRPTETLYDDTVMWRQGSGYDLPPLESGAADRFFTTLFIYRPKLRRSANRRRRNTPSATTWVAVAAAALATYLLCKR